MLEEIDFIIKDIIKELDIFIEKISGREFNINKLRLASNLMNNLSDIFINEGKYMISHSINRIIYDVKSCINMDCHDLIFDDNSYCSSGIKRQWNEERGEKVKLIITNTKLELELLNKS